MNGKYGIFRKIESNGVDAPCKWNWKWKEKELSEEFQFANATRCDDNRQNYTALWQYVYNERVIMFSHSSSHTSCDALTCKSFAIRQFELHTHTRTHMGSRCAATCTLYIATNLIVIIHLWTHFRMFNRFNPIPCEIGYLLQMPYMNGNGIRAYTHMSPIHVCINQILVEIDLICGFSGAISTVSHWFSTWEIFNKRINDVV